MSEMVQNDSAENFRKNIGTLGWDETHSLLSKCNFRHTLVKIKTDFYVSIETF